MNLKKWVEPALAIVKTGKEIVPYSFYAQALNGEDISRESYFPMIILTAIQRINYRTPGQDKVTQPFKNLNRTVKMKILRQIELCWVLKVSSVELNN